MRRLLPSMLMLTALAGFAPCAKADSRDSTIALSATTSSTIPYVTLNWPATGSSSLAIFVRSKGASSWGAAINLPGSATSYPDPNAQPGVVYEYSLHTPYGVMGALAAGYNIPLVNQRGNAILLVDNTMSLPLAPEIARLVQNMTADGWVVYRHDVPRQTVDPTTAGTGVGPARLAELQNIRTILQTDYNTAPTQNWSLMILGHVPVPYSGNDAWDGHSEHIGAWPTDLYYADLNGTWTDTTANNSGNNLSDARNRNIPGDGKFDNTLSTTTSKLATGRVDLSNMGNVPAGMTETQLLRQYLVRDHRFRRNIAPFNAVARRGIVSDNFGFAAEVGWRSAFGMFGGNAGQVDALPYLPTLQTTPMLYAFGGGGGTETSASGVGDSRIDFGHKDVKAVFHTLFGSWFGDWDCPDNFLRAPLAGTPDSLGLTDFWSGVLLYHMPLGDTIGSCARFSQNNNPSYGVGWQPASYGYHYSEITINLMGDPTLRLHSVSPPSRVMASSASGGITLTWTASPDAAVSGYHVYRSTSVGGPFTRLTGVATSVTNATGSPLNSATTSYLDAALVSGTTYTYLVKAVKVETTPSGTYANQSVGETITLTHLPASSPPQPPTNLTVTRTGTNNFSLSWEDNATNETGYCVERYNPSTFSWVLVNSLAANTTTTTDSDASLAGQTVYYRVYAINGAVKSACSNEAADYALFGMVTSDDFSFVVEKTAGNFSPAVSRALGTAGDIGVTYSTADFLSTAGIDYAATTGNASWVHGQAGHPSVVPAIPVINRTSPQLTKILKVTYSAPTHGGGLGNPSSTYGFITDPVAKTLPAPWVTATIGTMTPGKEGYAEQANGVFGIAALGQCISNQFTSDSARFVYQPITGDCQLTARLSYMPMALNNYNVAGGIMIRGSLDAGAVTSMLLQPHWTTPLRCNRSTTDGALDYNDTSAPRSWADFMTPVWMRLTRVGNTISISQSYDGTNWTLANADVTLNDLPATAYVGMFLSSEIPYITPTGSLNYARFDNVSVTKQSVDPPVDPDIEISDNFGINDSSTPPRSVGSPLNGCHLENGSSIWSAYHAKFADGGGIIATSTGSYAGNIAFTPIPATSFRFDMRAKIASLNNNEWLAITMSTSTSASIWDLSPTGTLVRLLIYPNGGISFGYGGGSGWWQGPPGNTITAAANFNPAVATKFSLIYSPNTDYGGGTAPGVQVYVNDALQGTYWNFNIAGTIHAFGYYVYNETVVGGSKISSFAISSPMGSYDSWASIYGPGQTAAQDSDNDGVPNGVEYFMGTAGNTVTTLPGIVGGTITWPKIANFHGTYSVEISTDLIEWTPTTTNVADNGTSVQYLLPEGGEKIPKHFARLAVTPN